MRLPALLRALPFLLLSVSAHAERDWHIGWLGGISQPTIHDPNGPTQVGTQSLWKDGVITVDHDRDSRFFVELAQQKYTLTADTTHIGQGVSRVESVLAYQWRFRVSREFKPWFGVGVVYANEKYSPRFTMTPTGFLNTVFPDRTESGIAPVVNATAQWDFIYGTQAGVHLQYEHGLSGLSSQLAVAFMLSY